MLNLAQVPFSCYESTLNNRIENLIIFRNLEEAAKEITSKNPNSVSALQTRISAPNAADLFNSLKT